MPDHCPRQRLRLDPGWKFHPGDIDAPLANKHIAAYMANKAGYARGAAKPSFDDSDWRDVDLPHDWSIEGQFDPSHHLNAGYLPRGIGWYRRYFQLEESDRGRSLTITFDGVSSHCTVYVNGHLLHRNYCGYTPFTLDITDIANFGEQLNVIAVRVDATAPEGWWYEGAGIYRHVWLTKTSAVHIPENGIHVSPQRESRKRWITRIAATVQNRLARTAQVRLVSRLADLPNTQTVSTFAVPPRTSVTVDQQIPIDDPNLWSVDSPNLYTLQTSMLVEGQLVDQAETRFGYRSIRFDANDGFFLNDQPLKLKGTCNHQDHAGVGVALPDSIHRFRIQRLKEMGCNAYRCGHNPPAQELLDACDELGMLVMDENRTFGSSPEHLSQLRSMVLRDRNHPSVILWSICNEEAIQGTPVSRKIAETMAAEVKKLDPTRPVTAAISGGILNDDCLADAVEVMGINYQPHLHEQFHAKHPNIPLLAAETHCALSTRGVYQTDPAKQIFDSYDSAAAFWGQTARDTWRAFRDKPYVAGIFIWTGFDYRGEPSPHEWPSVTSHWGLLDLCGFEKDLFHLHRAYFTAEPFVHLLPHWNAPASDPVRVCAYTNCDEVELLLNGQSLGRKKVDPIEMVDWQVPYEAGEIKAIGYRAGRAVAEASRESTGEAVALGLEIHPSYFFCGSGCPQPLFRDAAHDKRLTTAATTEERLRTAAATEEKVSADGETAIPVSVFAVDAQGRRVPTANSFVRFEIDGPARILGVGNGDPNCHEPDQASSRSLFNGLAQLIVQTTAQSGDIIIRATADGLHSAELKINSIPVQPRPTVPLARARYFVSDWRMSPVTQERPDPQVRPSDSDMNTWERVNPAPAGQRAWEKQAGFAVYRATIKFPRIVQQKGALLRFAGLSGQAEIYLDGVLIQQKKADDTSMVEIPLPGREFCELLILIHSPQGQKQGLTAPVEILPVRQTV